MRWKKQYGNYQQKNCPFCGRQATQQNEQGLDVCHRHLKEVQEEVKCACGSWLEFRRGKFGPYFHCLKCGNVPYKKGMTMKTETPKKEQPVRQIQREEKTITSRDVDYFD